MSTTKVHDGQIVNVTLAATATSGTPFLVGTMLVVPITDGAIGESIACERTGMHTLNKVSAQAWNAGAAIYWDDTAKNCTTTSAGNTRVGTAGAAAANPSSTGRVILGQF